MGGVAAVGGRAVRFYRWMLQGDVLPWLPLPATWHPAPLPCPQSIPSCPALPSHSIPQFGTPEEDAHRRDFTINSLFYNINTGLIEDFTTQ